jgi:hypothetical protein
LTRWLIDAGAKERKGAVWEVNRCELSAAAAGQIAAQLVAVPVDGLLAAALDGEVAQPLGHQRLQPETVWLGGGGIRLLPEQAREGVGSR